jgi:hypothetical protein
MRLHQFFDLSAPSKKKTFRIHLDALRDAAMARVGIWRDLATAFRKATARCTTPIWGEAAEMQRDTAPKAVLRLNSYWLA